MNAITQAEQNDMLDRLRELAKTIKDNETPDIPGSDIESLRRYGETAVPRAKRKIAQEDFTELLTTLLNSTLEGTQHEQRFGSWSTGAK